MRGKPYPYRLMYGLFRPKVNVLGTEVSGTVEDMGSLATLFRPGDRVYGDLSDAGFGGFAEYVCVRENALAPMPGNMTFAQAASLPHAGLLALQGVDLGKIRRGERVLINGAGGGVGMIGVQIAKEYGCEVTGVDGAHKLDALKALGFDHVLDYRQMDFTRNRLRYDLILDAKTTRSPFRYLDALEPGGRYVTVGGHLSRLLQTFLLGPALERISGKSLRVLALKPKALARFGESSHIGKIVIAVAA